MPGSSVWVFVTVDAGWRMVSVTLHAELDLEVESRHHVWDWDSDVVTSWDHHHDGHKLTRGDPIPCPDIYVRLTPGPQHEELP